MMATHEAARMIDAIEAAAHQAAPLAPLTLPRALAATVHGSRSYGDALDALTDYDPTDDGEDYYR